MSHITAESYSMIAQRSLKQFYVATRHGKS